jgi:hypothetical protein
LAMNERASLIFVYIAVFCTFSSGVCSGFSANVPQAELRPMLNLEVITVGYPSVGNDKVLALTKILKLEIGGQVEGRSVIRSRIEHVDNLIRWGIWEHHPAVQYRVIFGVIESRVLAIFNKLYDHVDMDILGRSLARIDGMKISLKWSVRSWWTKSARNLYPGSLVFFHCVALYEHGIHLDNGGYSQHSREKRYDVVGYRGFCSKEFFKTFERSPRWNFVACALSGIIVCFSLQFLLYFYLFREHKTVGAIATVVLGLICIVLAPPFSHMAKG